MSVFLLAFTIITESPELSVDTQDRISQCQQMCPPPSSGSPCRFTWQNLSSTPSHSTIWDAGGLAPSLPWCFYNGAVPLSPCCSLADISPFCHFTGTISSKSHLRQSSKGVIAFLSPARSHMCHAKMWHTTPCITDTHHSCWLRRGTPSLPHPMLFLVWCTGERLQFCAEV